MKRGETLIGQSFLSDLRAPSVEQGTNVLNSLKNVYLDFEALREHQFEYQCWLWGRYPQLVTYDACMKLSTNFVTKTQLNASRSELNIDVDLMTVLLQLSILSPIFFGGVRVQFVMGGGETAGSSPAWIGPGNRMSETFHKSQRGSLRSVSNEVQLEDGNGTALLEALGVKGKGIGDIGGLNLRELKEIFRKCFTSGISTFNNKEALVDLFERLHEVNNPQQASCDKLFVGRGSHASAGVMAGFVPTGVMVMHKVLLTTESPQGVADAVFACKENQTDVNAPGAAAGSDVAMQPLGRVCLPKLAHLESHNLSSTLHVSTSGTAMTELIHPRSSVDDVYALKDASSPSCYPQSQLDMHELLRFEAGSFKAGSRQGKAKQELVVNGLLPHGGNEKQRAAEIVRAGVGFSQAVSSVKILQVGLNPGVVPHQSADKDYRVDGYGVLFHDTVNHEYSCTMQDGSPRPHP